MKHLKNFQNHAAYAAAESGLALPDVSYCIEQNEVHYKVYDPYNGHDYVDLDLPSGTKWATMNVGARGETDYGLYFQWADTAGYLYGEKTFNLDNYKYDNGEYYTKYAYGYDDKILLDLSDDAARFNLGGEWRIPSLTQVMELIENTNKSTEGLNLVLTSKKDASKRILFPRNGYLEDNTRVTNTGFFWINRLASRNDYSYNIYNSGDWVSFSSLKRYYGAGVRGVIGETPYEIVNINGLYPGVTVYEFPVGEIAITLTKAVNEEVISAEAIFYGNGQTVPLTSEDNKIWEGVLNDNTNTHGCKVDVNLATPTKVINMSIKYSGGK